MVRKIAARAMRSLAMVGLVGLGIYGTTGLAQEPKGAAKAEKTKATAKTAEGKSAEGKPEEFDPAKLTPEKQENIRTLQNLTAALQLAAYGRQEKAPEVLLAAAKVIGGISVQPLKFESKESTKEPAKKDAEFSEFSPQKEAEKLISEARELAKSLPQDQKDAIETLAKRVTSSLGEKKRNLQGGSQSISAFYPANTPRTVQLRFVGGASSIQVMNQNGFAPTNIRIRVVGALTGIPYANVAGWNNATAYFNHLDPGIMNVTVANEGPNATTFYVFVP
jgi:hypothetical protein